LIWLGISLISFFFWCNPNCPPCHVTVLHDKEDNAHHSSKQLDLILTTNGE